MTSLGKIIKASLRLCTLRKPRFALGAVNAAAFFSLAIFLLLAQAGLDALAASAPYIFAPWGAQSWFMALSLCGLAAYVLAALCKRPALWLSIFSVLLTVQIYLLIFTALLMFAMLTSGNEIDYQALEYFYYVKIVWFWLVVFRFAIYLAPNQVQRTLPASLLALIVIVAPWHYWERYPLVTTDYANNWDEEFTEEQAPKFDPEAVMYAQQDLLNQAISALKPQTPGKVDLYVVSLAAFAEEDVFRNEVDFVEQLASQRWNAEGHVLTLINHADTALEKPLANITNLQRALEGVAAVMDKEEDILFLFITTHGSRDHQLSMSMQPIALNTITPDSLGAALKASAIRWQVAVISACYSGGFINALESPTTLVLTAARKDRTSFGCGAESEITYFGKAFLLEALNQTHSFIDAFTFAKRQIKAWEKAEERTRSYPQISTNNAIEAKLSAWESVLTPGAVVAFSPTKPIEKKQLEQTSAETH